MSCCCRRLKTRKECEKNMETEIEVNGVKYVRADSVKSLAPAVRVKGMEYAVVRTYSAGVFAGFIKSEKGQEVELINARRIWYWEGAASLSQLAVDGTSKPEKCKFPQEVNVRLKQVIEILPCSEKAQKSIEGVPVWKS